MLDTVSWPKPTCHSPVPHKVNATWRDAADSNTIAPVSLAHSTGSSRKNVLISEKEICLTLHVNAVGSIWGTAYGICERRIKPHISQYGF
ncbi:hypothetical protein Nmel_016667 [Mimus melanotis]